MNKDTITPYTAYIKLFQRAKSGANDDPTLHPKFGQF